MSQETPQQPAHNIKFSGIVVTFNDDAHLEECLTALKFCDELVVVDVGSTDRSVEIAKQFGCRIIRHAWVPIADHVRQFALHNVSHPWAVFMDPDLIFPVQLLDAVRAEIQKDPSLGVVHIPYRNYLAGKPVRYGRWGGRVGFRAVIHKEAVTFRPVAHGSASFRSGFNSVTLDVSEADFIKHYWADSKEQLDRKIERYTPMEGKARFDDGERFSYWQLPFVAAYAVFSSLLIQRGILDGAMGIHLSFLHGWCEWGYQLSLRDHQRKMQREGKMRPGRPNVLLRAAFKFAKKIGFPWPCRLLWGGRWLTSNDVISKHIFLHNPFEEGEQNFLLRFLREGMTALDVGAHHGLYTLLCSKRVGPGGRVIAFEPSPRELRRLRVHLRINDCPNVEVVPSAVGLSNGYAELFVIRGRETGCNSLRKLSVSDQSEKVRVPVTALDCVLENKAIRVVDFLKLDIEGAELDALKGARELLRMCRPIVMCELADVRTRPWNYPSVQIYDFLQSMDYQWFSITTSGKLRACPRKDRFHENLISVPQEKLHQVAESIEEPSCAD